MRDALGRQRVSERHACQVWGLPRSVRRRSRHVPSDQPILVRRMVALASDYGRYGYRRVTVLHAPVRPLQPAWSPLRALKSHREPIPDIWYCPVTFGLLGPASIPAVERKD